MRHRHLVALSWLQLCAARQPGFSIHHDLLAHPQYEVVFSESYISEPAAKSLVESASPRPSNGYGNRDSSSGNDDNENGTQDEDENNETNEKPSEMYEIMNLSPQRYLCAIPIVEPPVPPNKTATDLAKAEEARELARASAHGWELMNGLDGQCLYYVSGWWSYSFCYGHDVVQYHALPAKGGPPVKDPRSQEYVLGRVSDHAANSASARRNRVGGGGGGRGGGRGAKEDISPTDENELHANDHSLSPSPSNSELQVKGDQRYLVQRLDDGTICDLTNKPRTIEIQYHCSPGATQDRIGWIKEVTTCSYLMLINTPRLCNDMAFQPPREERANIISCRPILSSSNEKAAWHVQKTNEAYESMIGVDEGEGEANHASASGRNPIVIGGVVLGGRRLLREGKDGQGSAHELKTPRAFQRTPNRAAGYLNEAIVEMVGSGTEERGGSSHRNNAGEDDDNNNGQINHARDDKQKDKQDILSLLELDHDDPDLLEELKRRIKEAAADQGWRFELLEEVPTDGQRQGQDSDEEGDNQRVERNRQDGKEGFKSLKRVASEKSGADEGSSDEREDGGRKDKGKDRRGSVKDEL